MMEKVQETVISVFPDYSSLLQTVGKGGQKRDPELCRQLDDSPASAGLQPGPGLGSC